MAPFDLRVAEFTILMLVASNGDVNQKQLGRALDISPPNMAVTLDRMAESGWVERVRSTHDRRAQHIHLTAKGRALAAQARRISQTMEDHSLAALSPVERALLIELLRKIAARGAARKH
jgi:DNA-binding MarR family transcriptional regulator